MLLHEIDKTGKCHYHLPARSRYCLKSIIETRLSISKLYKSNDKIFNFSIEEVKTAR